MRSAKKYENIEVERLRKRMSSEEFAKALGITRGTLNSWLKTGNIPATKLVEMAKMFNCSTDYLLGLQKTA